MRKMITVGANYPVGGANTIRKASERYTGQLTINPGEVVEMTYCATVGEDGQPVDVFAVERLKVTSVAAAPLRLILQLHLDSNPAVRASLNSDLQPVRNAVVERIKRLYDVQSEDEEFLAIYFA